MLEYWYKEKRTLVDFRRGPLGPHFDAFAIYLKTKGYSRHWATEILGKCCQFNAFLMERKITNCQQLSESLIEDFLDVYLQSVQTTGAFYSPRTVARATLRRLFEYLTESKLWAPPKPKAEKKPYSWLLDPYLRYLRKETDLSERSVQCASAQVGSFLESLGTKVRQSRLNSLTADSVEHYIKQHLGDTPENLQRMAAALRRFFGYCAVHRYMPTDFSGLIPSVRRYRHASLPKGMEDSSLEKMLGVIPTDTPVGCRDYAMMLLMMAYGIRGVSVAELLLDDIDWQHSRIRIRGQKGGKEVVLPLMETVGEAIIRYLRCRQKETPFREVFLTVKAPCRPLDTSAISRIVGHYMKKAGVKLPGSGTRTLRHSWAIRALAHDSPIKSIADVLGHRYVNTTFIYAKADLKTLREVAMPWPKKG